MHVYANCMTPVHSFRQNAVESGNNEAATPYSSITESSCNARFINLKFKVRGRKIFYENPSIFDLHIEYVYSLDNQIELLMIQHCLISLYRSS